MVALLGRLLLAVIFTLSGLQKIGGFSGTVAYMTQHHLPMPELLACGAILTELGASIAVIVGVQTRLAATLLALFLVPATLIFHTNLVIVHDQDQTVNFLKNLAIIGGLLTVAANGPGPLSFEERRRRH